ncbi:MAG: choice-of-anchor J domain-containing protein, partial [Saprospiraceae bacterium]
MTKLFTLILCFLTGGALNAQVLLDENFEGGAPATWTQQTAATDGGWNFGTAGSLSSAYFPIPDNGSNIAATNDDGCNCDKNADYFITPAIDLSGVAGAVLKFDMFYADGSYQGVQEVATVDVSTDGGATWTQVEAVPGNGDNWQNDYIINVSAYAGNADVRFAFHYSDAGGWLYGWAIDNVSVYVPATNDVSVTGLDIPRFAQFGGDVTIQGEITNYGVANLTSFDISWSDGVNTYTDQVTGVDIPSLGTYNFTHSTTFPLPQAVTYNLSVWVDNPNNAADGNPDNNQQDGVVSGVTYIPAKKMVAEEATGTWCGWCPRGTE